MKYKYLENKMKDEKPIVMSPKIVSSVYVFGKTIAGGMIQLDDGQTIKEWPNHFLLGSVLFELDFVVSEEDLSPLECQAHYIRG